MVIGSIENKQNYSSYDPFWLQTEFEVIQSSSVLNDVIKRLGLNKKWAARAGLPQAFTIEQTYEILKKQISVRQSRNTSLIEIWVYSEDVNEAQIIFTDVRGSVIKTVLLQNRGEASLRVFAPDLKKGIYTYSIVADGKTIDSKQMIH